MDVYSTEQQQFEQVKFLSRKYGPWVIGAILIVVFANFFVGKHQANKLESQEKRGANYQQMLSQVESKEITAADLSDASVEQAMILLHLAKQQADDGDFAQAAISLEKILETNADNLLLKNIVTERLARVYLEAENYDSFYATINKMKTEKAYEALALELEGDAFILQEKKDSAVKSYEAALALSEIKETLEMKLAFAQQEQ